MRGASNGASLGDIDAAHAQLVRWIRRCHRIASILQQNDCWVEISRIKHQMNKTTTTKNTFTDVWRSTNQKRHLIHLQANDIHFLIFVFLLEKICVLFLDFATKFVIYIIMLIALPCDLTPNLRAAAAAALHLTLLLLASNGATGVIKCFTRYDSSLLSQTNFSFPVAYLIQ